MHKRPCFWKSFGSERVDESQKLLKFSEKYLYPTFSSFWAKVLRQIELEKVIISQNCLLTCWLPTTSILVVIGRIYCYQFKCITSVQYLKNQKHLAVFFFVFAFFFFFLHFFESTLNFEHFRKNESPSLSILKLLTTKDVLT